MLNWQYSKSFLASLLVHMILLVFLLFSVESQHNIAQLSQPEGPIIEAVVVDEKLVAAEVMRIQSEDRQHKISVEREQKRLKVEADSMKQAALAEQKKVDQFKKDMAKAKIEEQNRLAEIKLATEKQKKELDAIKKEEQKKKQELAALDDERQAEQDRAREMRTQREKEEKKQMDLKKQQEATQLENTRKADEAKRQATAKATKDAEQARIASEADAAAISEAQRVINEWGAVVQTKLIDLSKTLPADLECKVSIRLLPDGNVAAIEVLNSSGNSVFDEEAKKAVYRSQPFHLPEDPLVREKVKHFNMGIKNSEVSNAF